MTNPEFSNLFDVLYNNITSNQAPGLDEYEKSVFLNKAQDEIVKGYFNPITNKTQEGFDLNERRQIDFSMIMRNKVYKALDTIITPSEGEPVAPVVPFNPFTDSFFDMRSNTKSVVFDGEEKNILMFINEYVEVERTDSDGKTNVRLTVLPINYTEYSRLMSKPYKRPIKSLAWRLLDNIGNNKRAELIVGPNDTIKKYVIRYIKKPRAIRLITFDEGVTIDGSNIEQECELDPIMHEELLQRGVELAKAASAGDLTSTIALGTNSETPLGMIQSSK